MFFSLSKIFWALCAPLNLIFLILLGGALVTLFSRAIGRSLMVLGMFLFIVAGIVPTGRQLLVTLENQYTQPATMPENVDGILVLGGSSETVISEARGDVALNDSAERFFTALALAKQYDQALLVFSGGNGKLVNRIGNESADLQKILQAQQFPEDNVIYESESRNTYENFVFTKELVLPQPGETWLLVTSAFHMPRSVAVAKSTGWDVVPYPTDYRTTGSESWWPTGFNMLGNMHDLGVAVREYIGLIAYQFTGKISLPSP